MDNNTIDSLREALNFSPNNIPLKFHLAQSLLGLNRLDEAEEEYRSIIKIENSSQAKLGLAKVFYAKGSYDTCNVILEEFIDSSNPNFEVLLLHAKALQKENLLEQAIEVYKKVLEINPSYYDEELDAKLRITDIPVSNDEADEEDDIDPKFIQKPSINFNDVGGMDHVKKEIDLKIIQPLEHPEIYKAYGKKIGGGILLYGPPGCGKTFMAKATAGQVKAKFISVSLNDILDMWIGSSEKNLHEVFQLARGNSPCVLFFDEVDALGASRSDMKQSAGRHLINQLLNELDGLEADNEGILIIGATNTPWHLDTAFRRPGRFDRIIFVPPPDLDARESIFRLKLVGKPVDNIDFSALAKITKTYSGADIEAVIDIAIEGKLEEAIREGIPKPLNTKDLKRAIKKHKPSTAEWFATAKNFALYANESGLYDDILNYMKIKK